MAYDLVVIGSSWGGLHAISTVVVGLGAEFPVPVVFVQHRSKDSDGTLVTVLKERTALRVREPEDKEVIEAGVIYVAPPDYHLLIEDSAFALSTEAPVAFSRPSIDVLFSSAAEAFGPGVIGVILTGANADGARGLKRIKDLGGYALVQDPTTAEVRTMPDAAIASVRADAVVPLAGIPDALVRLVL